MLRRLCTSATLTALLLACPMLYAQPSRFDLTGPKLEVHVTRAGKTLPIALVPNLQTGDRLWLHPDLPPSQSVHYLLVAVFLRGTTNPPPDKWFFKIETWDKKVREEGVTITVPKEAQQVILFLAPETGGDFSTLRSAVRGRPGVFVRASQDLIEAGFEQARIEKYIASMRFVPAGNPKALIDHSNFLARTLSLKPNEECFQRPIDLQYNCLTQSGNQTLLDDGHGETIVASLTNATNASFYSAASSTAMMGGGLYSAYVGAVVDLVRIMSGLHTAHYQYIPAIAFPSGESLNLRLNTPPSFNNPKSVIVVGLPAIQASTPPPLRVTDPKQISCLLKPAVVLSVEGAPLVFSTAFAHDLVLHLDGPDGGTDVPVTPDAFQGGLVLARVPVRKPLPLPSDLSNPAEPPPTAPTAASAKPAPFHTNTVTGTIKGFWGFDPFTGPTLELQNTPGKGWKLAPDDVLIAGRENHLTLASTGTACIDSITLNTASGRRVDTKWKPAADPGVVDVAISLKSLDPGALHLAIRQYGDAKPDTVAAQTFSEPARLSALDLHAGDTTALLTGTSLDQVKQLAFGGLVFTPAPLPASTSAGAETASGSDSLRLSLPPDSPTPKFRAGEKLTARFTLNDGRTLTLPVTVAAPRPNIVLLNKRIENADDSPIRLADQNDLPVNQRLTFSLKSSEPFPRTGQIEIANADDTLHTTLSVAAGTLVLQNPHTLLATLDPLKSFGTSAFGPLRIRAVDTDGTTGDWLPLVTLVRLPDLKELRCANDVTIPCTLQGDRLYLVDSISTDAAFTAPTTVPEGFIGTALLLPRPAKTGFYLRLRDDPAPANAVTMPIELPVPTVAPTPRSGSTASREKTKPAATDQNRSEGQDGSRPASTLHEKTKPAATEQNRSEGQQTPAVTSNGTTLP